MHHAIRSDLVGQYGIAGWLARINALICLDEVEPRHRRAYAYQPPHRKVFLPERQEQPKTECLL